MKYVVYLCLLSALACSPSSSSPSGPESPKVSFFQWVSEQPDACFELTFNWDSLMLHRASEEPIACSLVVVSGEQRHQISAMVSTRGVHRKASCDFPPLKLILDKDFVEDKNWSKPRKYKLVTACQGEETDHLYREYLAYKLQELHTDYYLQSLLIPVKLDMGEMKQEGHLVLLEHEEEMARRLGFQFQDPAEKPIKLIHQEEYEKLVLFQYLIGNTDWNLTRGHNIKWLVKEDQSVSPIPVAYDFDQCGLVNAPYAAPYTSLPIKSVRERFLQYRGKDRGRLRAPWEEVLKKRDQSLSLIRDDRHLSKVSKEELETFLQDGYQSTIRD